MALEIHTGDLFTSGARMLVNAVNCEGVMGAGLAKQFKVRYPEMFTRYRDLCDARQLRPGSVFFDYNESQAIANAATKDHWRDPSRLTWVEQCLDNLAERVKLDQTPSLAVPPLGCGLGGLRYGDVLPLMINYLGGLDARVMLYMSVRDLLPAQAAIEKSMRV